MKNKGFTMVELLAVISILAIIILIAVPTFGSVRDRTNQSIYESKIASVKAAAEAYSEETGEIAFDVGTLIRQGKLEADNESGEYRNPVNGEDMSCYAVEVRYENLHYYANVHETKNCLTPGELQNLYGIVSIQVFDSEKKPINQPIYENWYNQPIRLGYQIKDLGIDYEIKQITWVGDRSITCTDDNLDSCEFYGEGTLGAAGTVQTMKASLEMVLELENGAIVRGRAQKQILIDMEGPRVVSVEASPGATDQSGKRVDIEMTDGNGSGLKEYRVVKVANENDVPTCKDLDEYQSVEQSKMTEYLDNGWYYTCVRDNALNDNQDTVVQTKKQVTGVDYSQVNGARLTVENQDENTPMKVKATITIPSTEDISKLKMCVSNAGHLKDCSWEAFKSSFDWTFPGHANCVNRTLYVSISDEVGNITNLVNNAYKPHSIAKFDGNGVTLGVADAKKSVCYDRSYSIPTVTRTGYTFNGWYTQTSGGTKLNTDDKVNYDGVRTYYAQWTVNNYYLDLNGLLDGTSSGNTNGYGTFDVYINNSKVATGVSDYYTLHPYGTSYEIKNINATTGHTYEGVYAGNIKSNVGIEEKNTIVQLRFKTNTYEVKYDANGGSGAPRTQTKTYGKNLTLSSTQPSRTNYTFKGWNTKSDGKGTSYGAGATYSANAALTLYAVWEKKNEDIYMDGDDLIIQAKFVTGDLRYTTNHSGKGNCGDHHTDFIGHLAVIYGGYEASVQPYSRSRRGIQYVVAGDQYYREDDTDSKFLENTYYLLGNISKPYSTNITISQNKGHTSDYMERSGDTTVYYYTSSRSGVQVGSKFSYEIDFTIASCNHYDNNSTTPRYCRLSVTFKGVIENYDTSKPFPTGVGLYIYENGSEGGGPGSEGGNTYCDRGTYYKKLG